MSDELAWEIIENLSEELGEKELKIMALEKELEEQKKQKLQYLEGCEIRQYKLDFIEKYDEELFTPPRIALRNDANRDLIVKVILHFFGGSIMTFDEIYEEIYCMKYADLHVAAYIEWLMESQDHIVGTDYPTPNSYWVCENPDEIPIPWE